MLLDTIKAASLEARKARDTDKAALLTTLYADAARIGKDAGNRDTTDEEVVKTVRKFLNGVVESLAVMTQPAAIARAQLEKTILEAFLPQQLSGIELATAVNTIVAGLAERTPKQIGTVMNALRVQFAGAYNGTEAGKLVKAALA